MTIWNGEITTDLLNNLNKNRGILVKKGCKPVVVFGIKISII